MSKEAETLEFHELSPEQEAYDESEIIPRFSVLDENPITTESVLGQDDRVRVVDTTALPFKAICKLFMRSPSGKHYIGTGWLVDGNKLYTAGHCVYDQKEAGWMRSVIVVPGKSGLTEPYGRYNAVNLMATSGWTQSASARYDMGAIKLSKAVAHEEFIEPTIFDADMAAVCGYPGDRDAGQFQYRMTDVISKSGGQFRYAIDTFGGQSGAPVLKNRVQAIGIHNYGGNPNSASDLYQEFIDAVASW
jgi:V8-like Glu-specific endopeptidase